MTNETLKVLEERFSCGAFTDELPEKEKMEAIARAAIQSPSGTNAQPWRVVVVTDKELIREMEEETIRMMAQIPAYKEFYDLVTSTGMKLFYNAPCMIVLPYDTKNPYAKFDCGIVSQSIAVAAQSLGVASHIIAINEVAFMGEKAADLKAKLHFPENYEFGLAVLLGNAAAEKAPHRPDAEKIIFVE
ncbi:MAG: nitroreductase family protein [Lachnospiraceae bacterium]|nr:nitroreductase family protein [Lachnospiraceae bacterium]